MPGRDLWGSASGFRDRRVPNFETVDPDLKPMSQDSFNLGTEFQLGRTSVFTINYVHNNLVRTIEDIGLLVDGDEVYLYANPGEGLATDALVSTATPAVQGAEGQAAVRRRAARTEPPLLGQLVHGRQLRLEQAAGQLPGDRQL